MAELDRDDFAKLKEQLADLKKRINNKKMTLIAKGLSKRDIDSQLGHEIAFCRKLEEELKFLENPEDSEESVYF